MGLSKALYEQVRPLDEEKPDERLERLYNGYKELSGVRAHNKGSDLFITFVASDIFRLNQILNKI